MYTIASISLCRKMHDYRKKIHLRAFFILTFGHTYFAGKCLLMNIMSAYLIIHSYKTFPHTLYVCYVKEDKLDYTILTKLRCLEFNRVWYVSTFRL